MGSDLPGDFEELFDRLYPRARGVALRIVGSVTEAEDVAAEAFARALVRWHRVGRLPHRDAWLLRVTANVAIDVARRSSRPVPAAVDVVDPDDDTTVLRIALVSALAALPRRQRAAVVLRHMADLSEADVAAALGVSTNTVKKHLQRGMARLRQGYLSDEDGASLAFD